MREVASDDSNTNGLWAERLARTAARERLLVIGATPVLSTITIGLNVAGQYLLKAGTGKVTLALSSGWPLSLTQRSGWGWPRTS